MRKAERQVFPISRDVPRKRAGAAAARYFFLWRIRFRSFLYLCLRIFLRRFLTTLLTPVSVPCLAATVARAGPATSGTGPPS